MASAVNIMMLLRHQPGELEAAHAALQVDDSCRPFATTRCPCALLQHASHCVMPRSPLLEMKALQIIISKRCSLLDG